MEYERDPVKDDLNVRKHRLHLQDGIVAIEDDDSISWIDDRFEYGEERILTLGRLLGNVLLVVTTIVSEERTRIISVRRAEKHEEYLYYYGLP